MIKVYCDRCRTNNVKSSSFNFSGTPQTNQISIYVVNYRGKYAKTPNFKNLCDECFKELTKQLQNIK